MISSFCFAAILEVLNVIVAEGNATIQLQNDNFTSNFTITYGLCSEDSCTTKSFTPPVVDLENLTANTTYCYLFIYNGNDLAATACNGTFTTDTETTPTTQPTTSDGNRLVVLNKLKYLHANKRKSYSLVYRIATS